MSTIDAAIFSSIAAFIFACWVIPAVSGKSHERAIVSMGAISVALIFVATNSAQSLSTYWNIGYGLLVATISTAVGYLIVRIKKWEKSRTEER